MPRLLDRVESGVAMPHYERALQLARRSDCAEAQFGAVVFMCREVLAEGVNGVYPHFKRLGFSCDMDCPRRNMSGICGGVAGDTCIALHAEEAAVVSLGEYLRRADAIYPSHPIMVVGHLKRGSAIVSKDAPPQPRCTKCANKIAHESNIEGVLFPVLIEGEIKFVEFDSVEFARLSLANLASNTIEQLGGGHR